MLGLIAARADLFGGFEDHAAKGRGVETIFMK
jgi:hypothetical protein